MSNVETWVPVVGFEGLYECSDHGRIRSVDRVVTRRDGNTAKLRGCVLKANPFTDQGHLRVDLSKDGRRVPVQVHRVIAAAYLGDCPEGHEVRHMDGDASNNVPSNLRYGTRSENVVDSVNHRTHWQVRKTHCPRGHELNDPNLVPSRKKQGFRVCLACQRTTSHVRRHPQQKDAYQSISDSYYEAIIRQEGA